MAVRIDTRDRASCGFDRVGAAGNTAHSLLWGCAIQPRVQFGLVGHEPHVSTAVGLANEVAKRSAHPQIRSDVTHDREPPPVIDELLYDLARDPASQVEEGWVEPC